MLTKEQQKMMTEEQMAAYCVSVSKYASKGYRVFVSKSADRTNPLSTEDGGAVVFVVDHELKLEVAYPNVKRVRNYAMVIYENRNTSKGKSGYVKNLGEIYSANHREDKVNIIYKDNTLY